eukprot:TRINITY_DN805_c0_g1_i5.p1 TRINITY_DN805_c0_g1~~TRINITY_DN805_c0_g1_i5.p1  ORF type:complete len:157 (-),score=18.19 TRINITY_DN805_c0_g1_i5:239-709(-)
MQLAFYVAITSLIASRATATRKTDTWLKSVRSRNLAAAGLPDPTCSSGRLSLPGVLKPVCCAGYCGECSDYPTCTSVREQDSENACCATKVYDMRCGGGAPANTCLKKCSESVPPCIMEDGGQLEKKHDSRQAGDDCNEAVKKWRENAAKTLEQTP